MRIIDIFRLPTRLDGAVDIIGFHESMFRAYHILDKTKELLELGTPARVVLDLIYEMESEGAAVDPRRGNDKDQTKALG